MIRKRTLIIKCFDTPFRTIPENGKIPTYSNYLFYFFHLMIRNGQTTNTFKEMQTPEYHYLCCELIKNKITT